MCAYFPSKAPANGASSYIRCLSEYLNSKTLGSEGLGCSNFVKA